MPAAAAATAAAAAQVPSSAEEWERIETNLGFACKYAKIKLQPGGESPAIPRPARQRSALEPRVRCTSCRGALLFSRFLHWDPAGGPGSLNVNARRQQGRIDNSRQPKDLVLEDAPITMGSHFISR